MKLLRQFAIIIVICFLGEVLNKLCGIPIPGNVLGMIILLFGLITKVIKLSYIEEVSEFLLKHLSFFFIPAGVGIIGAIDILRENWFPILSIVIITTILVAAAAGLTVQLIKGEN
jgi:holin-like protein